jgi:2-polyprenyl-3-methyl-5-hydroxy-6-metoxy-1,4-benzoquinol methylase
MRNRTSWYNQDQFWELIKSFLFSEQRQIDAKDEVKNLIKLLKIKKNDRILDLCCGIGRHSIELARMGFEVIGVDRTSNYIEKARQEAEQKKLEINFIISDMREITGKW